MGASRQRVKTSPTEDSRASDGVASDEEQRGQERRAAKRARLDPAETCATALGLEAHGMAAEAALAAVGAVAAHIDGSQEAEASLLRLETQALLAEARPDFAREGALVELLHSLAGTLHGLPSGEVAAATSAALRGFLRDLQYKPAKPFVFHPPARVQVVGSFAVRASARPGLQVDLAVEMPSTCFDDKDQLNHRYHAKRALYLAHVAAALRGHPQLSGTSWGCLGDDPRRPVLLLHPAEGVSPAGFTIRLLPALEVGTFPLLRLAPERNNLRTAVAAAGAGAGSAAGAKGSKSGKKEGEEAQLLPTPHYNTSILQDMLCLQLADVYREAAAQAPHFGEAAVLLRVWARHQQLSSGADGLGGCLLTLLLVHLLEYGQATGSMGAMQLVRAALVALSNPKTFRGTGLHMKRQPLPASTPGAAAPPDPKLWRKRFAVCFVDRSGWLNVAAGVSRAALAQAQAAAKRSLELLSSPAPEAFDAVFLARHHPAAAWDYWVHVTPPPEAASSAAVLGGDLPAWRLLEQRVEAVAAEALGNRARLVRVLRRCPAAPALKKGAPGPERAQVLLAVQVEPSAALRGVDIGPPADSGEPAKKFREFWGDKSELRRFQDGAICEAVMWECGPAERHLIVDRILEYALLRHLPPGVSVSCHAGVLDAALRRKHSTPDGDVRALRLCEGAYERLSKQLRGLGDGLPLKVVATQPLSAALRHAAAFPPLPHVLAGAPADTVFTDHLPRCLEPVEVLCQLEGSGKWPDSPEAFSRMKAALGCQLALLLQQSFGVEAQATEEYVDVLTDGFAFRLRLATERDAAMQQKQLFESGETRLPPEEDMAQRTWLQGAIIGIAGENPAFEPTVRLAKRWVGAHLLSPHLAEEAVELLVAGAFTGAGGAAAGPPASRLSGFLRFLRLLGDHPWALQPLIVDPSSELGQQQREEVQRQHTRQRAQGGGGAPALRICTPRDPGGSTWTAGCPSRPLLHRMVVLAQRSAGALEALLAGQGHPGAGPSAVTAAAAAEGGGASVFTHDAGEYAVLLHLRRDALPHADRDLQLDESGAPGQTADPAAAAAAAEQEEGEEGRGSGSGRQQRRLVEALLCEEAEAALSKHSRAILKGIPPSILQARGRNAVRRELLVGFDPLPLYVAALEARLGDLAVVCADYVGGALVALKWRPAAFVPGPLRPEHAHWLCPGGSAEAAAAAEVAGPAIAAAPKLEEVLRAGATKPAAVTVPDVVGALSDAVHMGAGLVEAVKIL